MPVTLRNNSGNVRYAQKKIAQKNHLGGFTVLQKRREPPASARAPYFSRTRRSARPARGVGNSGVRAADCSNFFEDSVFMESGHGDEANASKGDALEFVDFLFDFFLPRVFHARASARHVRFFSNLV